MQDRITGIAAKVERQQHYARRAERLDIAKHIMMGLLAAGERDTKSYYLLAGHSVQAADILIAELDKTDD